MQQFLIAFVIIKWENWNSIFELEPERVDCIVHNDNIFQFPIFYYPQVLYEDTFLGFHT